MNDARADMISTTLRQDDDAKRLAGLRMIDCLVHVERQITIKIDEILK